MLITAIQKCMAPLAQSQNGLEDEAMSPPPPQPKVYHITHVDNLFAILGDQGLLSDAAMIGRSGPAQAVGMTRIKERRLILPVECHPGDYVGDYVPFYFCPRSVMLYLLHRGNDPGLTYKGGQGPMIHLEADMNSVVTWARLNRRRWAFSLSNAGARYTKFRSDPAPDLIIQSRETYAEEPRCRTEDSRRETMADRIKRETREQGKNQSPEPRQEREPDSGVDRSRR